RAPGGLSYTEAATMLRERAARLFGTAPARALAPLAMVPVRGAIFPGGGALPAWDPQRSLLRELAVQGIPACGMRAVILPAGIGLAVGSRVGLSAVAFALFTMPMSVSAPLAIAAVVIGGGALGAFSGAFVARFRVQPFVVTLAMMVFARGLAKLLSGGKKVT